MRFGLKNIVACALLAGMVGGQTPAGGGRDSGSLSGNRDEDRETTHLLVQQVRLLQEKVAVLEARQGAGAATEPMVTATPAEVASAEALTESTIFQEQHEVRGIQWRGFGEVNYKVLD